ncbi:MAG: GTPase HflX [Spirochaetaceae bacterium]
MSNDNTDDKAVLVSVRRAREESNHQNEGLEELAGLLATLGVSSVRRLPIQVREFRPRFLVGSGKAEEIMQTARAEDAGLIVFDNELSPSQQRNWERQAERTTIDRQEVILEIFGRHASTREARLQVELARMQYQLPRLTRAWTHLSRQRGGRRGTRGEGEKQLEADRRTVLARIDTIRRKLAEVEQQRGARRKRRLGVPVPTGAIVGYTNAGKSSLLNRLSGAGVLVEDQLFATLDPTTRKLELEGAAHVLLTDTVGFIRNLPHQLIDAFHSTLEETITADFLIHVLDAASPLVMEHAETTMGVLADLGAADKPVITVLNKVDTAGEEGELDVLQSRVRAAHPGPCIACSARTGTGMEDLAAAVRELVAERFEYGRYHLPYERYDLAALAHRTGRVVSEDHRRDGVLLEASVPEKTRNILAPFRAD